MRTRKIGPEEDARLAALREFDALDGESDPELDEIVHLATRLFGVSIALVSLVDRSSQVFAARAGLDMTGTGRDVSFCAHTLYNDDILVIPDASQDPRFADNPLVTGEPHIRFYAGAPLRSASGFWLGSLCLIDQQPRGDLSPGDRESLKHLARLALDRLEHRRLVTAAGAGQSRFENIAATSQDAIVCTDRSGTVRFWNSTAERLLGYSAAEVLGQPVDLIIPPELREQHNASMRRALDGTAPHRVGKTVELEALHKDGRLLPIELSLSMWYEGGEASFGAILRDVSDRRVNEERLHHLAHHDTLTELPNRAMTLLRLAERMDRQQPVDLLLLDLDEFKEINASVGHRAADQLLVQIARRLLHCVRLGDMVARLGGDEFAVVLPGGGEAAAERICDALTAPFAIGGEYFHIGVSIGIARSPDHADTAEQLLANAELAMYQAKREGRRCARTYTEALRQDSSRRHARECDLRRALDNGEFVLFYQPQVSLDDGRLIGAEALVRWQHPTRGLLLPNEFLGAIEEALLAVELGTWVLDTACAQAARWHGLGLRLRMGVNLFEAQFSNGNLPSQVQSTLERVGLSPTSLELEITENIILRQDATMRDALGALHARGVAISFDDFGTGYASLSMLKSYPLSRLKIDRSFVQDISVNGTDAVIVGAVAALGNGLGLDVIAEGIETQAQRDLLRGTGCGSGQGYLFGRPMPADAFEQWVREWDGDPMQADLAA
ncbi:putative bifunctional diguanylate cyclase/phosphodiesterase [Sphingomonas sp. ac-8]|uniref:putative bifunctional diguanylate cyclase/phosphodiesterase n=1 Tax=Sphingomonas sp. ac-8 TaxID=3242977 RepID=UPI003A7FABC5